MFKTQVREKSTTTSIAMTKPRKRLFYFAKVDPNSPRRLDGLPVAKRRLVPPLARVLDSGFSTAMRKSLKHLDDFRRAVTENDDPQQDPSVIPYWLWPRVVAAVRGTVLNDGIGVPEHARSLDEHGVVDEPLTLRLCEGG